MTVECSYCAMGHTPRDGLHYFPSPGGFITDNCRVSIVDAIDSVRRHIHNADSETDSAMQTGAILLALMRLADAVEELARPTGYIFEYDQLSEVYIIKTTDGAVVGEAYTEQLLRSLNRGYNEVDIHAKRSNSNRMVEGCDGTRGIQRSSGVEDEG